MRIFVGNVAFTTTEDELRRLFSGYGSVERVQMITDRETGRSRGYAFVEMPNAAQAQAAIAGINGTPLGGRTLTVNEAHREGEQRRPRGDGSRRPREERRPQGGYPRGPRW
jgi:cold-inducible RNA-binding protein